MRPKREFSLLLTVRPGWGMSIAFIPEEFVTKNPTVKVRKPAQRNGQANGRQRS
jgi:hypothetical protein